MDSLLESRLKSCALRTESVLEQLLPEDRGEAGKLVDAMRYSLLNGGKRLRAFLTLTFCEACGGRSEDAEIYAAAVEMMHAFSLIHDDLPSMDNDSLRRGKPSNHIVFGESTALLAGDALAILSLETASENPKCSPEQNLQAVTVLSRGAGWKGMCGGQQIDLQSEEKQIGRDVLEELVAKKTGALFEASCLLGCIAAGCGRKTEFAEAARTFARLTGLAFQIADDLLDLHSTPEMLGKTPGKDVSSGKSTFPALLGEKEAESYAISLCGDAERAIDVFPPSEAKDALVRYCRYIVGRQN